MNINKQPTVMKFGGSSVKDAAAFMRAASIVENQIEVMPVVITSAMGGFTDVLLSAFEEAKDGHATNAQELIEEQINRHRKVAARILSIDQKQEFDQELALAEDDCKNLLLRVERRSLPLQLLKDAIVSFGEQLSSRLLAEILKSNGVKARHVDARRIIVTDDEYGAANPLWEETENLIKLELQTLFDAGEVAVIGGFIAANRAGETTTLGRGGSDYTAALIGAALDAREIQIWTDVTGVLTCDPRICSDARTVERLSYNEAAELAYFGAKVLHPKTIQPAVDHEIPVRVCNAKHPEERGTIVGVKGEESTDAIKAIAHKTGITILRISSARMLGSYGFMSALFQVFERFRTVIDVISTSEVSVALTLNDTESLDKIVKELERLGEVEVESGFAVICIVGEGLRFATGQAARIFSTISDTNVALISHGASDVNMTFVVKEIQVPYVIADLHSKFF